MQSVSLSSMPATKDANLKPHLSYTYSSAFSVFLVFLESTFSQQNLSLHHQCSAVDIFLMDLNSHTIQIQISSVTLQIVNTQPNFCRMSGEK